MRIRLFLLFSLISVQIYAQDLAHAPHWYIHVPVHEEVLFGIGYGDSLETAMTGAMVDLSAQQESTIFQEMVLEEYESSENGKTETSSNLEIVTQQVVNKVLENAVRADMKVTDDGEYYVLVFSPIDSGQSPVMLLAEITEELEAAQRKRRNGTTLASVILPGSGHISNKRYGKGTVLLSVALASAIGGTYSMIQANYEQNLSDRESDRQLKDYYDSRATTWGFIGLGCFALLGSDMIYASLDNYSQFK